MGEETTPLNPTLSRHSPGKSYIGKKFWEAKDEVMHGALKLPMSAVRDALCQLGIQVYVNPCAASDELKQGMWSVRGQEAARVAEILLGLGGLHQA